MFSEKQGEIFPHEAISPVQAPSSLTVRHHSKAHCCVVGDVVGNGILLIEDYLFQ